MVPDDAFACASKLEERLGPLSALVEWRQNPRSIMSPDNSRTYADQKWWGEKLHTKNREVLQKASVGDDAVRIFCQTQPHANSWLAVSPCVAKNTLIPAAQFGKLLRWTLGMDLGAIQEAGEKVACQKCEGRVDAKGHHFVCRKLNGYTARHHVVAGKVGRE